MLDTARGCPAAGIPVELFELGQHARQCLIQTVTNADGRTDAPLIERGQLRPGAYELEFRVAAYFSALNPTEPPFLDLITLRFNVADAGAHYHVPLLVSPWAYSTYRGS